MYFTELPDHSRPGFDEGLHFSKFKKYNVIFNAESNNGHCDSHVGCLSLKIVLAGEEWYGVGSRQVAVRPNQFLVLNDDQTYSCRIANSKPARVQSVFFKKEFAALVFQDTINSENHSLDHPFDPGAKMPEFFQTLRSIGPELQMQMTQLITALDRNGYDNCMVDEHLVFLLRYLIGIQQTDLRRVNDVNALKSNTRTEIYKRLCIASDILHSSFMDNPDLNLLSSMSCLSVPQLIRQFKCVFNTTPHQYLNQLKLKHAAELLRSTDNPIQQITWQCGFEDMSAFCRSFKAVYRVQPTAFRKQAGL